MAGRKNYKQASGDSPPSMMEPSKLYFDGGRLVIYHIGTASFLGFRPDGRRKWAKDCENVRRWNDCLEAGQRINKVNANTCLDEHMRKPCPDQMKLQREWLTRKWTCKES